MKRPLILSRPPARDASGTRARAPDPRCSQTGARRNPYLLCTKGEHEYGEGRSNLVMPLYSVSEASVCLHQHQGNLDTWVLFSHSRGAVWRVLLSQRSFLGRVETQRPTSGLERGFWSSSDRMVLPKATPRCRMQNPSRLVARLPPPTSRSLPRSFGGTAAHSTNRYGCSWTVRLSQRVLGRTTDRRQEKKCGRRGTIEVQLPPSRRPPPHCGLKRRKNRDGEIRTHGLLLPKQAFYQAELHPVD